MAKTAVEAREANRTQYERRIKLGLCRGCGSKKRKPKKGYRLCSKCLKVKLTHYYRNRPTKLSANKRYVQKLKTAAFNAYGGPVCLCCKEEHEEFLTIDHINGDGAEHRKEIGRSTYKLYLWLRNSGYPPGFRVLCMNCNFSYGMRGYCPHERERQACKMTMMSSQNTA
jgi:hypothetical protein